VSPVACLAVTYFSTLSYKLYDFRKKVTERKYVFSFSPQGSSETLPILRIQRCNTRKLQKSSCKVPVILVRFQSKLEFPQNNFKIYSNVKFNNDPYSKSNYGPGSD